MGKVRMQIDGRVIDRCLQMPAGCRVVGALPSNGSQPILIVEGPNLPRPNDDGTFVLVRPMHHTDLEEIGASIITGFEVVD